jgi:hypothetical protein
MSKIWILSVLSVGFLGCSSLSTFTQSIDDDELDTEFADEEYSEKSPPVLPMHISCCSDLCKKWKNVVGIRTEVGTKYIQCICKNGNEFRVTLTKLKGKRR